MKIKIISIWIVFFGITCLSILNAQHDSLMDIYNRETISYGRKFIRNDTVLRFKEIRLLLQNYPDSKGEYLAYKKNQNVASFLTIPGAILLTAFVSNAFRDDDANGIAGVSGVVFVIAGSIFGSKASDHLQRSTWLYNRDVLAKRY